LECQRFDPGPRCVIAKRVDWVRRLRATCAEGVWWLWCRLDGSIAWRLLVGHDRVNRRVGVCAVLVALQLGLVGGTATASVNPLGGDAGQVLTLALDRAGEARRALHLFERDSDI
jgi:hypothetical protein